MGPNEVNLIFTHKDNTWWEKGNYEWVKDKQDSNIMFFINFRLNTFIWAP